MALELSEEKGQTTLNGRSKGRHEDGQDSKSARVEMDSGSQASCWLERDCRWCEFCVLLVAACAAVNAVLPARCALYV